MSWLRKGLQGVKEYFNTNWFQQEQEEIPTTATEQQDSLRRKLDHKRKERELGDLYQPVLEELTLGIGGVQGLTWYLDRQRLDENQDVADGFFIEQADGRMVVKKSKPLGKHRLVICRVAAGNIEVELRRVGSRAKKTPD